MTIGFVYILGNPAMPGLYKVGFTERSPSARAEELSGATAIPCPFDVLCYAEFPNARGVEQEMHKEFKDMRITSNREFFRGDLIPLYSYLKEHEERLSFASVMVDYYIYHQAPALLSEGGGA